MKTLKLSIAFLFVPFFWSCSDSESEINTEIEELPKSAQQVYDQLMDAYNNSCSDCLENVLQEWEKEYTADENIPDSLKAIYEVYKAFYSPWDLGRISESEFGDGIYNGIFYYIIQGSISYRNQSMNNDDYFTITPFRPTVQNDTIHLLYYDEDYLAAMNAFLGSESIPFGEGNIMSPAMSTGETELRYRFLNNYLFFFHGHWGNYWHMETQPAVSMITFNAAGDTAKVDFRLGYQGGEATLANSTTGWQVVEHQMTWIE